MLKTHSFHPAAEVPTADLAAALTEIYRDYYYPVYVDAPELHDIIRRESIDLAASCVMRRGRRIVATGLLAHRGQRAWIGGVGVTPNLRGRGIGRTIVERLLQNAAQLSIKDVQLEVIRENAPALKLYLALGFTAVRDLHVMLAATLFEQPSPPDVQAHPCPPRQAYQALEQLPGSASLPWMREIEAFDALEDRLHAALVPSPTGDAPRGACLYYRDYDDLCLFGIAAQDAVAARALLSHAQQHYPTLHMVYLNVPNDDPLLPILVESGLNCAYTQHEMHLIGSPH